MEGLMTRQIFPRPQLVNRRGFLLSVTATVASTGVAPAAEEINAAEREVVGIGPPERPRTDIDAWNVGLISARRPELTPAQNLIRDGELRAEIRQCFGLLHLRGRYVADYGLPHVNAREEYACFVISHADDSGKLKGFLKKYGRKYGQESVIYKGYYRDAILLALRDLPAFGIKDGEMRSLGRFHPDRLGILYTLMTRGGMCPPDVALEDLRPGPDGVDWLGGRWGDIGLWSPKSFFNRTERRMIFDKTSGCTALAAAEGAPRVRCDRARGRSVSIRASVQTRMAVAQVGVFRSVRKLFALGSKAAACETPGGPTVMVETSPRNTTDEIGIG
jgi:hypothetical protein